MKKNYYDTSIYKIATWKNPIILHWIINPALAFNELVLGQRIPKITLIEKNTKSSTEEKYHIPCPHCQTIHPASKWSAQNNTAFKNWFGLYCDQCHQIIPCVTNLFSYVLMGISFPIWYWFKDTWKANWLKKQPERFKNITSENKPTPYAACIWQNPGFIWAFMMYLSMAFLFPVFMGEPLTLGRALINIPIWALAGFLYNYGIKYIQTKYTNT